MYTASHRQANTPMSMLKKKLYKVLIALPMARKKKRTGNNRTGARLLCRSGGRTLLTGHVTEAWSSFPGQRLKIWFAGIASSMRTDVNRSPSGFNIAWVRSYLCYSGRPKWSSVLRAFVCCKRTVHEGRDGGRSRARVCFEQQCPCVVVLAGGCFLCSVSGAVDF